MSDSESTYVSKCVYVTSYSHFLEICDYMNDLFGKGRKNWRVRSKVKRHFERKPDAKWIRFSVNKKHKDKIHGFEMYVSLM